MRADRGAGGARVAEDRIEAGLQQFMQQMRAGDRPRADHHQRHWGDAVLNSVHFFCRLVQDPAGTTRGPWQARVAINNREGIGRQ